MENLEDLKSELARIKQLCLDLNSNYQHSLGDCGTLRLQQTTDRETIANLMKSNAQLREQNLQLQADNAKMREDVSAAFSKLKTLPRFSFLSPREGGVRRFADTSGNWIEHYEAVKIYDALEETLATLPTTNAEHDDYFCRICKRPFDDSVHSDCGGDCLTCMAEAGDPDCVAALDKLDLAAGKATSDDKADAGYKFKYELLLKSLLDLSKNDKLPQEQRDVILGSLSAWFEFYDASLKGKP